MYDYCIVIGQNYPEDVRLRRKAENKRTTYYTCCTEAHPNTFTFSDPAEAAWMSFYSSKKHLDGYLRWAYNSWPLEPLLDSVSVLGQPEILIWYTPEHVAVSVSNV